MKENETESGLVSPLAAVARSLEDWETETVTGGYYVGRNVEKPGDGDCGPVGSTCTGWTNNGGVVWGDIRG